MILLSVAALYAQCQLGAVRVAIESLPPEFAKWHWHRHLPGRAELSTIGSSAGTPFEFAPGLELRTCSDEDLMVMKLLASRAIDIGYAEGIAVRHDKTLDWSYSEVQLTPLGEVKEEPEIQQQFARIRRLNATL